MRGRGGGSVGGDVMCAGAGVGGAVGGGGDTQACAGNQLAIMAALFHSWFPFPSGRQ